MQLTGRMQAGPSSYSPSYHQLQQAHLASAADYELKRRYLSLLPPQQIIEICLTSDIHVPPYAKSTIWPVDLNAAIAALQNAKQSSPPATDSNSSQNEPKKDQVPPMDSLVDPSASTSSSTAQPVQEPTKPPSSTTESPGPPSQTSPPVTAPSTPAPSTPQPATPMAYPPHQRYEYTAQPAFPHTPYYPPQHVWPPYPHPHLSYPPPSAHYPPPSVTYPAAPHMPQPQPPPQQQSYPEGMSPDDLPSYEDMIVEALNDDVTDPEGLAPKDLYTWMASHYPVQSNFRASASQALQKAFRRGRFEKSSGGKYRLNPEWKGGTTTRRTTRRPQTLTTSSTSVAPQPRPPPFTNAPLVHHQQRPPVPFSTNPPYMFGYPPPNPASHEAQNPASTTQTEEPSTEELSTELGDAFEAAQHILKAINFGELLKISQDPKEGESTGEATGSTTSTVEIVDASESSLVNPSAEEVATDTRVPARGTNEATESVRAELQAQLALLAAQLSEIAHDFHETIATGGSDVQVTQQIAEVIPSTNVEESDDDEDMDEVVVV